MPYLHTYYFYVFTYFDKHRKRRLIFVDIVVNKLNIDH